ncbi:hypothetical protein B0T14DRAFT_567306 [Immersiella caudata]|uniref:Uncharacterized protein n=1 Tax=Immersiella caudata TaxID=314043 RepID=A0AA39WS29_9PEZI|nr:hypothetical protein B0T14DRAFT_567306 [Immersiella caudata]
MNDHKKTTPANPKIDTDLSQNLVASTSPTTPHSTADAARAMSSTGAWQPRLDRRQSWDSQEWGGRKARERVYREKMSEDEEPIQFEGVFYEVYLIIGDKGVGGRGRMALKKSQARD